MTDDGTGNETFGHFNVTASHSGRHFGRGQEPFKSARVEKFRRRRTPYALLALALEALGIRRHLRKDKD